MKIALVTESFLPNINGVTNSVIRILEYLSLHGHEALVIAPSCENSPTEYAGFRVKTVPSLAMKGLIPVALPQRTLEPLLEGFSPDVIHLASPIFLGHYVAKIATKMKIPTLSVYQTDIAGFARHYGLTIAHSQLKRWVARIHSQTTRTLAPSTWSCRDLQEYGVKNVHLWQRGVDTERFSPSRRSEIIRKDLVGENMGKLLVGYIGRLANEKCINDLAILDQSDAVQLVIVGDGPARSKLERTLPNARFMGFRAGDELAQIYASLDLFIHTGKHETFCQAVQEALSSGTPVIAPHSGGPIDLVRHEETGYLIDTSDKAQLLNTVLNFQARSDRDEMSLFARDSVVERTWANVNKQLIGHYRSLVLGNDFKQSPEEKFLVA